ncbi:hypothetical protein AB0L13_34920 [Saccharopolyspora shandongensis]|uniref:hypothetical protein n=1 Tax=Saccharopolyspora shandongensis TaxID=418495 RepID=UPI0034420B47
MSRPKVSAHRLARIDKVMMRREFWGNVNANKRFRAGALMAMDVCAFRGIWG